LEKSKSNEIYTVDGKEIVCLAKNSKKEKTLIFTFGIWCAPCIKHLPEAIKLADDYQLDFYVLLIDKEENNSLIKTINYLQNIKKDIKILVLKDSDGNRPNKKYKKFLAEITPSQFEDINGMSKYIVINNKGKVLMVTNWKDSRDNDWDDDSKMIEKRIIPILN
jgi:thiol-disulfide isomerase/thioredoxin